MNILSKEVDRDLLFSIIQPQNQSRGGLLDENGNLEKLGKFAA